MEANGKSYLELDAGGVSIKIYRGDRIGAAIERDGDFEPETLKAWAHACCGGGQVAIDVGAYCGIFAIAAAKFGLEAIAIEPRPELVNRIRSNARLNDVWVEVVEAAASSQQGEAFLFFRPDAPLTSISALEPQNSKQTGMMEVKLVCLDDLLDNKRVGVIKVDVEGHEAQVLKGGHKMVERDRPIVITECLERQRQRLRPEIKKALPGYRNVAVIDRRNLVWVPV